MTHGDMTVRDATSAYRLHAYHTGNIRAMLHVVAEFPRFYARQKFRGLRFANLHGESVSGYLERNAFWEGDCAIVAANCLAAIAPLRLCIFAEDGDPPWYQGPDIDMTVAGEEWIITIPADRVEVRELRSWIKDDEMKMKVLGFNFEADGIKKKNVAVSFPAKKLAVRAITRKMEKSL